MTSVNPTNPASHTASSSTREPPVCTPTQSSQQEAHELLQKEYESRSLIRICIASISGPPWKTPSTDMARHWSTVQRIPGDSAVADCHEKFTFWIEMFTLKQEVCHNSLRARSGSLTGHAHLHSRANDRCWLKQFKHKPHVEGFFSVELTSATENQLASFSSTRQRWKV